MCWGMSSRAYLTGWTPGTNTRCASVARWNNWVAGRARERMFFCDQPMQSPTLNKIPLVALEPALCLVNSTTSLLHRGLTSFYEWAGRGARQGVRTQVSSCESYRIPFRNRRVGSIRR